MTKSQILKKFSSDICIGYVPGNTLERAINIISSRMCNDLSINKDDIKNELKGLSPAFQGLDNMIVEMYYRLEKHYNSQVIELVA